ncbi:MAG TPA: deoxyribodipyrimidine photo-lyase [Spirochaetota bacterium]|nr:deoxyribodipyrimidine photo-lyase [Spirochaetota bacterium]HOS38820.1 deoxyribodipyrimidine photo-lyase [Spirochaetota bacterium]HPU86904.1 deoxyribodipyrimidine photo-lyase [Spirochaetota bacterium]
MIHPERIQRLNEHKARRENFVLYWMQQSQRTTCNHALAHAIDLANGLSLPVIVYFGLTPLYPGANARHYTFLLQGLTVVRDALLRHGIPFIVRIEDPATGVVEMARDAALAVTDRGYTRIQRTWRAEAARNMGCPLVQVESDVVVPVETASSKEEYTAATLRPKLKQQRDRFLVPLEEREIENRLGTGPDSLDVSDSEKVLARLGVDERVPAVNWISGGQDEAEKWLEKFIKEKLKYYDTLRNDPSKDYLSHLSPYLHFGHISPLRIALRVMSSGHTARHAFLEELIVRRELAMNFVHYNNMYDRYDSLPAWALKTLEEHAADRREYEYRRKELEEARTHDPYWNAAQRELLVKGKMHGYMRMYWGKKIIEWSASPRKAFDAALYLNDRYSLDGCDPNGYAGVAWCFGKHDRPWREREIFGTVRYMNARGLERKFDIRAYARAVEEECGSGAGDRR